MRILLVEDSEGARITLAAMFTDEGHEVIDAESLADARARLAPGLDAVLLDLTLPDGTGTDLVSDVRRASPAAVIVLHSGADSVGATSGVDLVVGKDSPFAELLGRLEAAVAAR